MLKEGEKEVKKNYLYENTKLKQTKSEDEG
jgi:hypothetical protein